MTLPPKYANAPTPRTDAAYEQAPRADYGGMSAIKQHSSQLERELLYAREVMEELKDQLEIHLKHTNGCPNIPISMTQALSFEANKAISDYTEFQQAAK